MRGRLVRFLFPFNVIHELGEWKVDEDGWGC